MTKTPAPFAFALSLAAAAVTLSLTPAAFAADACKSDADCGAGFYCEIIPAPSVGCASPDGMPTDCPAPQPAPASEGYCREKPLSCSASADCPSYMECVSEYAGSVTCDAPACAPGESCPEPAPCEQPAPDPSAPKLCAPKVIECKADADCPTGFACNSELPSACPAIACAPGEECPQPDCPPAKNICAPKEIDCKADADCPSDWRCFSFQEGSCSSGGSTGGGTSSGGTEPAPTPVPPSPGSKTLDEPPNCTVTTRNLCAPKGYLAGIEQGGVSLGDATGSPVAEAASSPKSGSNSGGSSSPSTPSYSSPTKGSATTGATSSSASSDSEDGCSTSGRGDRGGLLGALLIGLVARLARKRAR